MPVPRGTNSACFGKLRRLCRGSNVLPLRGNRRSAVLQGLMMARDSVRHGGVDVVVRVARREWARRREQRRLGHICRADVIHLEVAQLATLGGQVEIQGRRIVAIRSQLRRCSLRLRGFLTLVGALDIISHGAHRGVDCFAHLLQVR